MADLEWERSQANAPPKSARAIARESRDRPWEKNLKLGTAYKRPWRELEQDNTWGGRRAEARRKQIFARKAWQEPEQDLRGLPYEENARRVFDRLQPENPAYETSPGLTNWTISAEILSYLEPSVVEKSLGLWQEIKNSDAFLGKHLQLTGENTQCQSKNHNDRCACKELFAKNYGTFIQNLNATSMTWYLRYIDEASQYPKKKQQMQLMFWLGLKDAYSASHQLIQQVLLARPALVHDRQDCELDPIFLEEYALFQAIIVHDLGRIVNLVDFEDVNEEQAIYIGQYKAYVNRFYHQTESSYLSNMDFASIFRSRSSRASAPTMDESSRTEVSPPQFKRDWKGYIDWFSKWLRPVAELDLGCTARYVAENANAYAHLLDASTGQFSYDDACEVPNWHLSRIYHALENVLREYMCITEDECLLVKAKQILRQKWPVSNEVLYLMELILRYRRAAHSQFSSDDITDRHMIWDDMLVEVRWHLAQSAREASRATSPFVEPRSREPLHGEFRDSISKRWRVNRWSIKPFISTVKDMQYHVSR